MGWGAEEGQPGPCILGRGDGAAADPDRKLVRATAENQGYPGSAESWDRK